MDATLQRRAEEFAGEFSNQLRTAQDLTDLTRLMVKSLLERMLNTELDVHLGRKALPLAAGPAVGLTKGDGSRFLTKTAWSRKRVRTIFNFCLCR
ncbi:MAG: hypothetical protein IT427_06280 [Pirellulales bacterium]|nr:hypothetical protein [Pirellulales bacterium]